jgi:co-chaperonin GroES (HSP10)
MKLRPVRNNVHCRLITREETTEGGIVIPDMSRYESYTRAIVIEAGPECKIAKEEMIIMMDNGIPATPVSTKDKKEVFINENAIMGYIEFTKEERKILDA